MSWQSHALIGQTFCLVKKRTNGSYMEYFVFGQCLKCVVMATCLLVEIITRSSLCVEWQLDNATKYIGDSMIGVENQILGLRKHLLV